MKKEDQLSKRNKLLIVVYEMSQGKQTTLKYEDIFVKAYKKYSDDFHLRGYPEYPDTGDATQRPLYNLRKEGFIQVRNKFVTLTEKGMIIAKQLVKTKSFPSIKTSQKLTRDIIKEIERIKNSDVFCLYVSGKKEEIVDTDFFYYLGTTVRTERTDFRARIKTIKDIIDTIKGYAEYKIFINLNDYLFEKFEGLIKTKLSIGYPRRNI